MDSSMSQMNQLHSLMTRSLRSVPGLLYVSEVFTEKFVVIEVGKKCTVAVGLLCDSIVWICR